MKDVSIVFVGAGNLASGLAKALHRKNFSIVQVYSRTEKSARSLAVAVGASYTTRLEDVVSNARLYIVSLKDTAFVELLPTIANGKSKDALLVHTAGSISMSVWEGYATHYGVFYPLQTFSKQRDVDFCRIPFLIEAGSREDVELLKEIASALSERVCETASEERRILHLAAVFCCNFANHMYTLASELLSKYHLPFDVMLPLIDETAAKVHEIIPVEAQTGPAIRYDERIIRRHLELLSGEPEIQQLYELISRSIHRCASIQSL